jgi:predicted GIY-YIG superfamily endonuclease
MHYAYILRSEKAPYVFYHGYTSDLRRRLATHNRGGNLSTKIMRPWVIAWYGAFETADAARTFEHYLKTASGKAFARKRLLVATLTAWTSLTCHRFEAGTPVPAPSVARNGRAASFKP